MEGRKDPGPGGHPPGTAVTGTSSYLELGPGSSNLPRRPTLEEIGKGLHASAKLLEKKR